MKKVTFFFLLAFASTFVQAQDFNLDLDQSAENHSLEAIKQIQRHLLKNLEYPEEMLPYEKDGTLILEVSIEASKKISEVKILISFDDEAFDSNVLDAMDSFAFVDLKEEAYLGKSKISLPIRFTID